MEKEKRIGTNKGLIYSGTREELINQMFQLQRLQEEGISTNSLLEETHDKLMELVEMDDKEKLGFLRQELEEMK